MAGQSARHALNGKKLNLSEGEVVAEGVSQATGPGYVETAKWRHPPQGRTACSPQPSRCRTAIACDLRSGPVAGAITRIAPAVT